MKGYVVSAGYMGLVDGNYELFATEEDYYEYEQRMGKIGEKAFRRHEDLNSIIGTFDSICRYYSRLGLRSIYEERIKG